MELAEWAARYGVVAGITTRGHGFSLGLWSEENVGQVMSRWRAVGAAVRPRFPGVVLAHQVHGTTVQWHPAASDGRSEEHTSELQSRFDLVCRLLLEKKKKQSNTTE